MLFTVGSIHYIAFIVFDINSKISFSHTFFPFHFCYIIDSLFLVVSCAKRNWLWVFNSIFCELDIGYVNVIDDFL